ncbi:TetR/AcrR family transcriptional regulator [Sedimentibacter saalensis]|uniref:TetR family transcriptional regulator n=1 Tax=Sedimentibacter saalensis TaxID=130788 RepID=A0A562JFS0_9FIRM|nr:TetR/AcrR family transcriptional regulator [Sedimentibacter saalensis]TWH81794.1 TetR family transcriptional regulator [Sedimentibacter saalensis]
MPKSYSSQEKEYIVKRLKEEAYNCLNLYGVKKTTVDELVRRVNIPKGTFYLFYDSKELLLFDVVNDLHDEIQKHFIREANLIKGRITAENLTNLLFKVYKMVDDTFLLKVMTNGELELIIRKLPNEIVEKHFRDDYAMMEKFMELIPHVKEKNVQYFSGALRGVFLTMLHKREIGEEVFDGSLKLMINGLVIQLMEE